MFDRLHAWDLNVLYYLNVEWSTPWLDQFWGLITQLHKQPWFLFFVLPVIFGALIYLYRAHALKVVLVVIATVALTDAVSYRVIKRFVHRERPFNNPEISWVQKKGEAHGYSFPSNHAANCFAGAAILTWYFWRWRRWFYSAALLIALSRPALGVHYPSDILGGALLGTMLGLIVRGFVLNQWMFLSLPYAKVKTKMRVDGWRTRAVDSFRDI